jgi:hypothetical protein
MENKSLNIFNSKYVVANPATTTDATMHGVQRIIAHEYFHNWTGETMVVVRDHRVDQCQAAAAAAAAAATTFLSVFHQTQTFTMLPAGMLAGKSATPEYTLDVIVYIGVDSGVADFLSPNLSNFIIF